jgi:hypothetical protein
VKPAYIDTSLLIGVRFQETSKGAQGILRRFELFSSELMAAEVRAFAVREGVPEVAATEALDGVNWVLPDRSLSDEIRRVANVGYLRGADLWHVACAFFLSPNPADLAFLTLDHRQREVAAKLGFKILPHDRG